MITKIDIDKILSQKKRGNSKVKFGFDSGIVDLGVGITNKTKDQKDQTKNKTIKTV